jgi:hypothetical protein
LLLDVSLRVPPSNLREFSLFCACPSNKHCPSAHCAYAANVAVGKDCDIFALGAVSFNYVYANQPKIVLHCAVSVICLVAVELNNNNYNYIIISIIMEH